MNIFITIVLSAIFLAASYAVIFFLTRAAKRGDEMAEEVYKKK